MKTANVRHPGVFRVCLLFLALAWAFPASLSAGAKGTLTGRVVDPDGNPVESAHVQLEETSYGGLSDQDGRFSIRSIPHGRYTLQAVKPGFQSFIRKGVIIGGDEASDLLIRFEALSVFQIPEVGVTGERLQPLHEDSEIRHAREAREEKNYPGGNVRDVLTKLAGVIEQAGNIHVQGTRSGTLGYRLDGVKITDPLGGAAPDFSLSTVATTELISGGLEAQYGDVQSGVVNITTREGGEVFSGEFDYSTDDYGAPDKTFDNFDRLSLGLGGPTGVRNLTWFASFQGTFQDGWLRTAEKRPRSTLLDFIRVGPRQNNDLNAQAKLSWKPRPGAKLTLEQLRNHSFGDIYAHVFSRNGYVQTRVDTLAAGGRIVTRYGRFSAVPEDSTFVPYNAAEHTPDVTSDFQVTKFVWTHSLGSNSFYSVKLSRVAFDNDFRVGGKEPWEYDGAVPRQWQDQIGFRTSRYFATNGDYPRFLERHTKTWGLRGDWTQQIGEHEIKGGTEFLHNDLSLRAIDLPTSAVTEEGFGLFRSRYHYYNPEASLYIQDGWRHEGMIVNAGLRWDAFSVGSQLDASEVGARTRSQISPRLGIAYPITDRDVLSFHYGRFNQVPDRGAIFENRGATSQVRGNPDLQNETTVGYQAAVQHMFSRDVYGQFAVYFKDIFGQLSVQREASGDNPNLILGWVNRDYASARGFELSIEKRFSHNFSGNLAYTHGLASGVASDPEQQRNVQLLYLPISEQPLDWDQRHTLTARLLLQQPEDWLASAVFSFGSGFPYTPTSRNERRPDPSLTNAGRLPSTTGLSLQLEKHYRLWNEDVLFFLQGTNVLDARNIANLEPDNWPFPPGTNINDYRVYYTETGRAGGAYLGEDQNGDGVEDWVAVNDPRVFAEGRNIRMGMGLRF